VEAAERVVSGMPATWNKHGGTYLGPVSQETFEAKSTRSYPSCFLFTWIAIKGELLELVDTLAGPVLMDSSPGVDNLKPVILLLRMDENIKEGMLKGELAAAKDELNAGLKAAKDALTAAKDKAQKQQQEMETTIRKQAETQGKLTSAKNELNVGLKAAKDELKAAQKKAAAALAKQKEEMAAMQLKQKEEVAAMQLKQKEEVAAMQLKMEQEAAARESTIVERAAVELGDLQLKLDEATAARESAAKDIEELKDSKVEMQLQLDEATAARESAAKDIDELKNSNIKLLECMKQLSTVTNTECMQRMQKCQEQEDYIDKSRQDRECPICFDERAYENNWALVPCGHVFCKGCASDAVGLATGCYTCQTAITDSMQVFGFLERRGV